MPRRAGNERRHPKNSVATRLFAIAFDDIWREGRGGLAMVRKTRSARQPVTEVAKGQ